jgi:signal transduction histidine kinase
METETARCGEIVKNLLEFSRQTKPKIEQVDLGEVIEKAVTLLAHEFELKSIKLNRRLDPELPKVRCDAKQIQQVVLNLLVNAAEATPEGGVVCVDLLFDPAKYQVAIQVEDTGTGISPEDLKHIFEPFFSTKEEGKGVGLGLSVVYGIVTKHGGTIEVESQLEEGTRFRVRLPVGGNKENGRFGQEEVI